CHSRSMFEDQQARFSFFVHELNRFIAAISSDLRRHAFDVRNYMSEMARLNRVVATQHDLHSWRISSFRFQAYSYQWKALFFRLRPSLAKHLKPGGTRFISFTEFSQILSPCVPLDVVFHDFTPLTSIHYERNGCAIKMPPFF